MLMMKSNLIKATSEERDKLQFGQLLQYWKSPTIQALDLIPFENWDPTALYKKLNTIFLEKTDTDTLTDAHLAFIKKAITCHPKEFLDDIPISTIHHLLKRCHSIQQARRLFTIFENIQNYTSHLMNISIVKKDYGFLSYLLNNQFMRIDEETSLINDSAFHFASSYGDLEAINILLKHNAPINQLNKKKQTPLMFATIHNKHRTIEFLISHNATVNLLDADNKSAINYATPETKIIIINALKTRRTALLNKIQSSFWQQPIVEFTELHLTADEQSKFYPALNDIFNRGEQQNLTAKHLLFIEKMIQLNPESFAKYIDHSAINNLYYKCTLAQAVALFVLLKTIPHFLSHILTECMHNKKNDIVKFCIQQNIVNVNEKLDAGKTLLMIAAGENNVDIIKLLSSHQANVNLQDNNGKTALMFAEKNKSHDAFKYLLSNRTAKTQIDLRDRYGQNCLMLAASNGNVIAAKQLIQHNADIECKNSFSGWTSLCYATVHNQPETIRLLILSGADETFSLPQDLERIRNRLRHSLAERDKLLSLVILLNPLTKMKYYLD